MNEELNRTKTQFNQAVAKTLTEYSQLMSTPTALSKLTQTDEEAPVTLLIQVGFQIDVSKLTDVQREGIVVELKSGLLSLVKEAEKKVANYEQ